MRSPVLSSKVLGRSSERYPQEDIQNPKYELLERLGTGNFGVAWLMRDRETGELVAVKYLPRGDKVDKNVERELINHRILVHPNIVQFREAFLTPTHLGVAMEYAAGGELWDLLCKLGKFKEDLARYFFQQLIIGVDYCHQKSVCHRDIKLENLLLDGRPAPRLKLCDFGYSKSGVLNSKPDSIVGSLGYFAPEVLAKTQYDGAAADVWSCGVTLFALLTGVLPFDDPTDPSNFSKTARRILAVHYEWPVDLSISAECLDLTERIFQADPQQRITITGIRQHPWFQKNLAMELQQNDSPNKMQPAKQSIEELRHIVAEARQCPARVPAMHWHNSLEEEQAQRIMHTMGA